MSFAAPAEKILLLSAGACLLLFTATVPLPRVDGHLIGSDGLRYAAILRSAAFDRDFDFANDYALFGARSRTVTATGRVANPAAIGAAILWAPFYGAAHLASLFLNGAGVAVPTDGVSYVYEYAICAATIVYACIGFILAFRVAARVSSVPSALIAVLALWWATQAIYYLLAEPSMSHGLTVFSSSLFLFLWYPPHPRRALGDWIGLGLAAGLVALVRWQDGVVLLVPLVDLAYRTAGGEFESPQLLSRLGAVLGGALIAFLPQCLMWAAVYGSAFTIPQGGEFLAWSSPQIVATLFSSRHGLISWHPVFLLALLGLPMLWRRSRPLAATVAFLFLTQLYVNSSVVRWWADDAFGGRRFTSLVPLLVPALACLLDGVERPARRRALVALLALLVVWNGLSFVQYRAGFVSRSEALTLREMTVDRLLLPVRVLRQMSEPGSERSGASSGRASLPASRGAERAETGSAGASPSRSECAATPCSAP
jgi:hypothetical protein